MSGEKEKRGGVAKGNPSVLFLELQKLMKIPAGAPEKQELIYSQGSYLTMEVKCHKCGYVIQVKSKKRPLKVKCPRCKAVGILRTPPPEPEIRKKEEAKPKTEIEKEVKEKKVEPHPAPSKPIPVSAHPITRNFLKSRIVKPVAIILVIAIILTGIQLVSLISTGETVIVPDDFGVPEEFENATKEFDNESVEVKQKAEGVLNQHDWNYTPFQAREIRYETVNVNQPKPKWPGIFEDIEKEKIVPESTYVSWTHTTTTDFNNNCSDSVNVNIADDMIKLQTLGVGMFVSKPLDSGIDNAVLKDVTWHPTEQPGESQIVIIIEISDTEDGPWKPIWSSAEIETLPDWFKELFPDLREFVPEFTPAKYFRYTVGFYSIQPLKRPYLEDITISVTITALDRKYYAFTYYQSDTPLLDEDGVAGVKIPGLITIPEYNLIDVDENGHGDIAVSLMLNVTINEPPPPALDWATPPTYLIGGLDIEIYKIKELEKSLTIYFVKPICYDNTTYIWIIGFYFSSLPEHFSFNAISENIEVKAVPFMMGGETPINVQPPYKITWSMTSEIPEFSLSVGYAKLGPVNATHYFEAKFSPGINNGYLRYDETPEKLSLNWSGSNETDVSAYYKEENLYVEFEIDNLPSNVDLSIESGEPCSTLDYKASSVLSAFSYTSYDFVSGSITHVSISNIPLHINIIGTFKIPPKEEPNPDPSDSFIGRVLNYVIARIGATMNRVRKAMTSVTETISTPNNIFHLIPDGTIAKIEFWSLKGIVENDVIYCERLNLSGNYVGMLNSSIQAGLKNVTELNLSFGRNITLMLKSSGGEGFKALGLIHDMKGLISIPEMPDTVSIKGTPEEINYSFSESAELNILAKTQNYNMDAWIKNITSGSFIRKDQNISLEFDSPVELSFAAGKGQLYSMTENHLFVNTSKKTMSLRLSNLKSLYAGRHLGLTLSKEYPLKMLLETNITSGKILVKPLPRSFNISLPMPPIALPEMENMIPTMDLFSSFTNSLEQAIQNLNETVGEGFINGTLAFSYESDLPPVLVANLTAGKDCLSWHHGITLKKSNLTLDMKIYLELPENAIISFEQRNGAELRYKFENWNTSFNWISASLETENKNLFVLASITDLKNGEGIIKMVEEEPAEPVEEKPPRVGELNLSINLFLASIPQKLDLTIIRGSNTSLSWSASSSINGIYLNIIREDNNISYPSYLIVKNTPVKADFTIISASKATIFQIPEINVNASGKLDFNLKLDGGLVGSNVDLLLYTESLKYFSLKGCGNTVTINSDMDKLLFRMSNISLGGMNKIEIMSLDLQHLLLTTNFVFGKFPVLEVNCDAKETQIKLVPSVSTSFGEKNSVALTDLSFLSLHTRENSVRITDTKTHYITVAPVLSLWM